MLASDTRRGTIVIDLWNRNKRKHI